jgi:hypothetical protein
VVLVGDRAQVEARSSPFGDSGNHDARLVHGLRQTYHRLKNLIGRTRWHSKVTRLKWNLDSLHLEIVLLLAQDRCTVCAECTTASKIVFDAPNDTPR